MSDPVFSHPPTTAVLTAFNDALNRRDLPAMLSLLTPNTVFENTFPAPDGERFAGKEAVGAYWEQFFRDSGFLPHRDRAPAHHP